MALTRFDIDQAFSRLQSGGLPVPPAWEATSRVQIAAEWVKALGAGMTAERLAGAVTDYLRSEARYWPTPGQLLKLVVLPSPHGPSWQAPDPHGSDWYALRASDFGPVVRYLPHAAARRRGLARADDAVCPDPACQCEAVEIVCLTATLFGAPFHPVLRDHPPRRWAWPHVAATLPPTGYAVVRR